MKRYMNKPVFINAVQYNGKNIDEIESLIGPVMHPGKSTSGELSSKICFDTDIGLMSAVPGCYIIRHEDEKISVMTESEFNAEYQPVD